MLQKFVPIIWYGVAALHLLSALALPLGHADAMIAGGGGMARITTHDCGAREHHIPIEDFPSCQLCTTQIQRCGVPPLSEPAAIPSGSGTPFRSLPPATPRTAIACHTDTRGPPSA